MSGPTPVLDVRGLTRSFGPVRALGGVDLTIHDGEVLAVLGPSGCGKTTLLRIIAGFLAADRGDIDLAGRAVLAEGRSRVATRDRSIGYVPQEGALFPHLDVAANITFGLTRSQRHRSQRRRSGRGGADIGGLLELLDLDPSLARRFPHELSGGQQQRVAVARALARKPSLLLLDEPFSSLDASLRESTGRAVVRAVRATGAAALLVTHDQDEALSLADVVGVMSAGRVVQTGTPSEVYARPADPFVASFVGTGSVVPAKVVDGVAMTALGDLPVPGTGDGEVDLFVRPEQVVIDRAGATAATVTGFDFYGHDACVHLALNGHEDVLCRVRGDMLPSVDDEVRVTVVGPFTVFGKSR